MIKSADKKIYIQLLLEIRGSTTRAKLTGNFYTWIFARFNTVCLKKMVIKLWSALARSLYHLQKSFFHSRKDQAFSFRMSPFL